MAEVRHSGTLPTSTDVPQRTNTAGVTITDGLCLIMDEVDGMSAGDSPSPRKNASGSMFFEFSIICIANDRSAPK